MSIIPKLFHGNCPDHAKAILKNGWQPRSGQVGGNAGQSRYLYLTTGVEDAEWFANEKGCSTVIAVLNVPMNYLIVDPEDGVGDTIEDELRMSAKHGMPAKFALTSPLPADHFMLIHEQ